MIVLIICLSKSSSTLLLCSSKLKLISALEKLFIRENQYMYQTHDYPYTTISFLKKVLSIYLFQNIEFAQPPYCLACLIFDIHIYNSLELIYYWKSETI